MCECCRNSNGRERVTMGRYTAILCSDCATKGHALQTCLLCLARLWNCAFLTHFVAVHPRTLEKVHNDPFDELALPDPPQRIIGQLPARLKEG